MLPFILPYESEWTYNYQNIEDTSVSLALLMNFSSLKIV